MTPRRPYTFDERAGRYRGPGGRFVRWGEVRAGLDRVIERSGARVKQLTESLRARSITAGEWEHRMRSELSALHVAAAEAAKGGRAQMSQADWGRVGREVRTQFEFLRARVDQIISGQQALDGTLTARATLYAEAEIGRAS